MSGYVARIAVGGTDSATWHGDLVVGEFATETTAIELGQVIASAVAAHTGTQSALVSVQRRRAALGEVPIAVKAGRYIVLRPGPDLPPEFSPAFLDGTWHDLDTIPKLSTADGFDTGSGIARPTGRFETRDDGMTAQVWEVN